MILSTKIMYTGIFNDELIKYLLLIFFIHIEVDFVKVKLGNIC